MALVALDSAIKCQAFLDRTGLAIRGVDAGFDILTTALSTIATAVSPLATAHALAAAAAISSGTKSAIDADVYAKQTAWLIGQQIDSTYFADFKSYVDKLENKEEKYIDPPIEILKIQYIHRQCDIDKALAALASKTQTAGAAAPVCSSTKVTKEKVKTSATIVAPRDCISYFIIAGPTASNGNKVTYLPMTAGGKAATVSIDKFLDDIINLAS